jgi:hypothetical protein
MKNKREYVYLLTDKEKSEWTKIYYLVSNSGNFLYTVEKEGIILTSYIEFIA